MASISFDIRHSCQSPLTYTGRNLLCITLAVMKTVGISLGGICFENDR